MTLESLATWLENLAWPTAIRDSALLFPTLETVHVLALALVFGSIATVDLRLLGLTRRTEPAWLVVREVLPWTWASFAVAVASGGLLFASAATNYIGNLPFLIKMGLLVVAGINMSVFHYGSGRGINDWEGLHTPRGARFAGALSIVVWVAIVAMGRWIGFVNAF